VAFVSGNGVCHLTPDLKSLGTTFVGFTLHVPIVRAGGAELNRHDLPR
jgi:hypothetical protein